MLLLYNLITRKMLNFSMKNTPTQNSGPFCSFKYNYQLLKNGNQGGVIKHLFLLFSKMDSTLLSIRYNFKRSIPNNRQVCPRHGKQQHFFLKFFLGANWAYIFLITIHILLCTLFFTATGGCSFCCRLLITAALLQCCSFLPAAAAAENCCS